MKRTKFLSITAMLMIVAMGLALFLPLALTSTVSAAGTTTVYTGPTPSTCVVPRTGVHGVPATDIGANPGSGSSRRSTGNKYRASVAFTEYPVATPDNSPQVITPGPDGNLWFTEAGQYIGPMNYTGGKIGRMTTSGSVNEYTIVTTPNSQPWGITPGPDGNLWFTEATANKIGRINPSSGLIDEYPIPTPNSAPWLICHGPDGNVWFTESWGNKIGKITMSGAITEYTVPTAACYPDGITPGPDGNIWFGEAGQWNGSTFVGGKIGMITPSGVFTEYNVPTADSYPGGLTPGPDGNVWFTEQSTGNLGMIVPSTAAVTEYPIPTASSRPMLITAGPDGDVWFTEFDANKLGKINPWGGAFTEYDVPTANSLPNGLALGPDNALWFTELRADNVGRAQISNSSAFYFAEGTTRTNFDEYLCLGNPNNIIGATANVTYIFTDGTTKDASYTVPANSRFTVSVKNEVGADKDVSIRVLSDTANLIVERPMYFNYNGKWTGGSDAVGAPPNTKWYFAEGNTLNEFDQYLTVLNPGAIAANLTFHYMVEGSGEQVVAGSVGPHSRATFKAKDQIGTGKNMSLFLESDQPVVTERPMYFNYQGLMGNNWTGGHDAMGTNSPAKDWYFAEGTTRNNAIDGAFEEWLCMQNPGTSPITVNATYQLAPGQGDPIAKTYTVPAQQRLTVSVNREIGAQKDDSVRLSSTSDFIAERPLYFNFHTVWTGGHDVLGANTSALTWFFAEGTTRTNFDEWLCLQNPGNNDANASIIYYRSSGAPVVKTVTIKANTRLTVSANVDVGPNQDISAKIQSNQPIIVERPMYFNYNGVWTGGHDVMGFAP